MCVTLFLRKKSCCKSPSSVVFRIVWYIFPRCTTRCTDDLPTSRIKMATRTCKRWLGKHSRHIPSQGCLKCSFRGGLVSAPVRHNAQHEPSAGQCCHARLWKLSYGVECIVRSWVQLPKMEKFGHVLFSRDSWFLKEKSSKHQFSAKRTDQNDDKTTGAPSTLNPTLGSEKKKKKLSWFFFHVSGGWVFMWKKIMEKSWLKKILVFSVWGCEFGWERASMRNWTSLKNDCISSSSPTLGVLHQGLQQSRRLLQKKRTVGQDWRSIY